MIGNNKGVKIIIAMEEKITSRNRFNIKGDYQDVGFFQYD